MKKRRDLLGDEAEAPPEKVQLDVTTSLKGVSVSWICQIFRMDAGTAKRKLIDCPEVGKGKGNAPLYDIAQAAGYLVKPKVDIKSWVKSLRPADLPPYLQSEFWEAQNKRQKWEENAGELWRTEAVIEVFADTFKVIKETMNLWVDNIERKSGVTPDQRKMLVQLVDGLQDELHQRLIAIGDKQKTPSSAAELADIEQQAAEKERDKFKREFV